MLQKKADKKESPLTVQPINSPSFTTSSNNIPPVNTDSNNKLSNSNSNSNSNNSSNNDTSSGNENVLPVSSICSTDTTLAKLSVTCLRFNIEVVAKARASGCVHAVSTYTIFIQN